MDCDEAAKRAMRGATGSEYVHRLSEEVCAMLWSEMGGLTTDPYDWIMMRRAREVVMMKFKINVRAYELVAWEIHGNILKKIQPRYRPGILKQIWYELPNTQKLERNGYSKDGICPCAMKRMTQDTL